MGTRQFSLLFLAELLTSLCPWVNQSNPQFPHLSTGVGAPDLAHGSGCELANITENSKCYWQSQIPACLCLLRKLQSMTKTLDWLYFLLLYLWKDIHASKFRIEYFKASGNTNVFWFLLIASAPAPVLITRMCHKDVSRCGRLRGTRLTNKNCHKEQNALPRSPAWLPNSARITKPTLVVSGMPMAKWLPNFAKI
jgi:hypothetical protein